MIVGQITLHHRVVFFLYQFSRNDSVKQIVLNILGNPVLGQYAIFCSEINVSRYCDNLVICYGRYVEFYCTIPD